MSGQASAASKMMFVDLKRCIGCNACSVACIQENNLQFGIAWNRVYGVEGDDYPKPDVRVLPMFCQHCSSAACKLTCDNLGYRAIVQRADGIVYVDQSRCVGCQKCVPVCPFKAMFFNTETNKAEKCHYCMHRIDAGLAPACVITCMGITREFASPSELLARHPHAAQMMRGNANALYENMGEKPMTERATAGNPGASECHW